MTPLPPSVADFLAGKRIVVAGVSRSGRAPANAIFRRLRACGHEVVPVNPHASELEGVPSYPTLAAVPGEFHGVLIATHPSVGAALVREAAARGVRRIWFHRSFGAGSVSPEALDACRALGIFPIVGGCPLMYCGPVDPGHRFFRWWLRLRRRIPA
jgi:predicted CoA-binding protein